LGLPVVHIFEDDLREQVDPAIYDERIGFVELAVDSDAVKAAMKKLRNEE
jgi:betaine reductase